MVVEVRLALLPVAVRVNLLFRQPELAAQVAAQRNQRSSLAGQKHEGALGDLERRKGLGDAVVAILAAEPTKLSRVGGVTAQVARRGRVERREQAHDLGVAEQLEPAGDRWQRRFVGDQNRAFDVAWRYA